MDYRQTLSHKRTIKLKVLQKYFTIIRPSLDMIDILPTKNRESEPIDFHSVK